MRDAVTVCEPDGLWMISRPYWDGVLAPTVKVHDKLAATLVGKARKEMKRPDRIRPGANPEHVWGIEVAHEGHVWSVWNQTRREVVQQGKDPTPENLKAHRNDMIRERIKRHMPGSKQP